MNFDVLAKQLSKKLNIDITRKPENFGDTFCSGYFRNKKWRTDTMTRDRIYINELLNYDPILVLVHELAHATGLERFLNRWYIENSLYLNYLADHEEGKKLVNIEELTVQFATIEVMENLNILIGGAKTDALMILNHLKKTLSQNDINKCKKESKTISQFMLNNWFNDPALRQAA